MMNSSSPKKTIHDKSWVIGIDDDEILQALKQFMTNHQTCIFFHKEACSKERMYKAQAPYALVITITEF